MCIGIPMQVYSCEENQALCRSDGQLQAVDISLVGPQPQDTWLLVFLGAAREVITAERAEQVSKALQAMSAVMQGDNPDSTDIDHLFADLIAEPPQLPEHLQALTNKNNEER